MAKYIYKKYNSTKVLSQNAVYREVQVSSTSSRLYEAMPKSGYLSYNFDSTTGLFSGVNYKTLKDLDYSLVTFYEPSGNTLTRYNTDLIEDNNRTYIVTFRSKLVSNAVYTDVKSSYIGEVTAEDGTYPQNGKAADGYWYVRDRLANVAPIISGTDADLGGKKGPFTQDFSVNDADSTQTLNVTVSLNNTQIQTFNNATRGKSYQVDITQEIFNSLTLNQKNTIEISVSDGNGATAIRRYYFTRTNTAPTVAVDISNMGEQNLPFSINYTCDDADGDDVTCKIFIDDVQIVDVGGVTRGEKKSYTLSKIDYSKLLNGTHKIRIEATDSNNAKGYGYIDFTKNVKKAWYRLKKQTEGQPLSVAVQPMVELAEGAILTVKVCNNALDTAPTWETIPTESVGSSYTFTNKAKTNANWAVGVEVQIERGTATKDSYFYGFVGNYQ